MPVCERYEAPLPMKMAHFNMPLHVQAPDGGYIMEDHYHDNGMTSPHELGPWMDDQSDGGGKFRLKRRRRCGQCGPCQVKENCGKCQYCVRKDVLKQACIYRKCVYLRKPVPRFRPEAASASNSSTCSSGGGGVGGAAGGSVGVPGGPISAGSNSSSGVSSAASKPSPQKPSTPSAVTNSHSSVPSHHNSQPATSNYNPAAVAAAQSAELSSCQLAQNPFGLPMNNGVIDPLRNSALDQHRSPLFDATCVLEPSRTSYLPSSRPVESGRSPALDLGRNTNTADSGFGTGSSMTTSPANSVTKDRPSMPPMPPREQYRSPMEQWGSMPYGFPRPNPWAHPAFQPSSATAYGFQPSTNHFPTPFGSSCRLGMPDPASHLASPSQPSFHHNMPFARPDFSAHASFRASAPSMQPAMTPPFYPPPPHIPSSLPNFPSFSQLPSSAGPHAPYPMAHPPMYPGNFYPSFRPPTEPQIYHAHMPPPYFPFMHPDRFPFAFPPFSSQHLSHNKGDSHRDSEEDEEDMKKKFSVFRISNYKRMNCDLNKDGLPLHLTKLAADQLCMQREKDGNPTSMLLQTVPAAGIDDDLQQQMRLISRREECDVISIDDFKMHAFIRSDGFNNLEIEIESPVMEDALHGAQCLPDHLDLCDSSTSVSRLGDQEDVNNNRICERDNSNHGIESENAVTSLGLQIQDENGECNGLNLKSGHLLLQSQKALESQGQEDSESSELLPDQCNDLQRMVPGVTNCLLLTEQTHNYFCAVENETVSRTLSSDVVVHLFQEGEEGVTELEVPGTQVQLEEVHLNVDLLTTSSNPQDLLQFISQHMTAPTSPDPVFHFEFDRDPSTDLDTEELS